MNRYKMKMISGISHKLKTPLNCSLNLLKLLIEKGNLDIDIIKNYIDPSFNSNLLLSTFINDICDYSEIEMGSFHIELSEFNIE